MPEFIAQSKDFGSFRGETRHKKPVALVIRYTEKGSARTYFDVTWHLNFKEANAEWNRVCRNPDPRVLITGVEFVEAQRA